MGVPEEAITAVLDVLDAVPCGAAGWLRQHGVAHAALLAWRRRILECRRVPPDTSRNDPACRGWRGGTDSDKLTTATADDPYGDTGRWGRRS
jgi:hypothetical protein